MSTCRDRTRPTRRSSESRRSVSLAQVARDLGVADQTLRNWIAQSDVDEGRRGGLTSDEREELRRLRRENRVLREERAILKEAAAFFAVSIMGAGEMAA